MKTFRHFLSYYRPYMGIFLLDLVCAFTISIIDVSFPMLLNYCVRSATFIIDHLNALLIGLLIMYAIRALARYYVSCQGHIMGVHMERDMRKDLFEQYQKLSFSYYDENNTGVMMSRMVSDLFEISEFAHHGPENLFISLVKVIGSFVIMSLLNVRLAAILLGVTVILFVFTFFQNRKMKRVFMDNRQKIGQVNAGLQDSLAGVRVVKSFANETMEMKKFERYNDRYVQSKEDNYHIMGFYYGGTNFLQGILYVTVLVAGGYFIARGWLSPLELATFALYINVYVAPLEILVEFTEMLQKGLSGFKRFEEVMEEIPTIQNKENAIVLPSVEGDIRFEHVSFGYDEEEKVLEDVNLHVPAGRNLALVGPSGGGKTTLCSLIPRFYDVLSGAIYLDGVDIRDLDVAFLRKSIGHVQQDVYLFSGSIKENIAYGKENASDEEIVEAAKKANIHEFIVHLPDGYDTFVGERGARLSGGQKQRISIARVFLKDPKILILDEATSALDNESERVIQKSLEELSKNRTCITIAHRLSTIQNADEIVVVDEDGIKEQGSHEVLMAKDGLYAKYYRLQFD